VLFGLFLFLLLIFPRLSAIDSDQEVDLSSCLERNYSLDICRNTVEKIADCVQTKPLDECEKVVYGIADTIVKMEVGMERSKNMTSSDIESFPPFPEKFPESRYTEYEEITNRIYKFGGPEAIEELNSRLGKDIDPLQVAKEIEEELIQQGKIKVERVETKESSFSIKTIFNTTLIEV
jgi:hypothetical protein